MQVRSNLYQLVRADKSHMALWELNTKPSSKLLGLVGHFVLVLVMTSSVVCI